MREVSTVAAYRDRWHITSRHVLGPDQPASIEQKTQRQRAQAAAQRADAINPGVTGPQQSSLALVWR